MSRAGARVRGLRPLDPLRSLKTKLGVLVAATCTTSAVFVWAGLHNELATRYTLPLSVLLALAVTQVLSRGMTSPLREMAAAAQAMARGDYSRRVRATSRDEVGELARAFNTMAADLARVHQVVTNLVDNALRHSPPSSAVTVSAAEAPGGGVRLEVADLGPGI